MFKQERNSLAKKVLIADEVPNICEKILKDSGIHVDLSYGLSLEELISKIQEYDGIIVRSKTKITSEVIEAAKNLKIIGRPGAGVDNIDIEAANKKGIAVVITPFSNKISVAELVFSYMINLSRSIIEYDRETKKGEWKKGRLSGKSELYGKTIGIVGLGNIGKEVAKRAEGFGMKVIYYDPFIKQQNKYKQKTLEELFRESDFVTIHIPAKEDTTNLITYKLLSRLKKNAVFINTSRAKVVERNALEKILEERKDIRIGLDVFYNEKNITELKNEIEKLAKFKDRVILTPHIGASTHDAQVRGAKGIAEQIVEFFRSGRAPFALNIEKLDEEYIPYRKLAEKLAYLACHIIKIKPTKVEITCYGELEKYSKALLNIALMPVLRYKSDLSVNEINASYLARERKIETRIRKPDNSKGYGNTITLDLIVNSDNAISIRGTIDEDKVEFMRIGEYESDSSFGGEGKKLMAIYDKSHGILEAIAHVFAKYKIDILSTNLGRDIKKGKELLFLTFEKDKSLTNRQLSEIKEEILKRRGKSIKDNINVYQVKPVSYTHLTLPTKA